MTDQTAETAIQQQETVTKQKNSLRIEQGKSFVEYNHRKKEKLKHLNEQITKQDGIEHKPKPDTNTYVYVSSLSVFGLAIGIYLLYSNFKKPKQTPINVPIPPVKRLTLNQKEIFLKCSKNFYPIIYDGRKLYEGFKRKCLVWCSC